MLMVLANLEAPFLLFNCKQFLEYFLIGIKSWEGMIQPCSGKQLIT